jgi:ubiquitin thioesterase OTU1
MLSIRVKHQQGQQTIKVARNADFNELKREISKVTLQDISQIKAGFPPKLISGKDSELIESMGIRNGDVLIVESGQPLISTPASPEILVRVQKDDNSCLFNSINYIFMQNQGDVTALRALIKERIKADPENYSDAILGRPREEYCAWITSPQSWGGGIELMIFADHFQTCIVSVDVSTGRFDRFGENKYGNSCYVVYSGIHYDCLALSSGTPEFDQLIFDQIESIEVEDKIRKLVAQLKKDHKYTDLASFTLKCGVCNTGLRGQNEAQQHAITTGHTNFTEYS